MSTFDFAELDILRLMTLLLFADVTFYLSADRSSFSAKGQNSFASNTVSLDKLQNQILQIRKATNGGS